MKNQKWPGMDWTMWYKIYCNLESSSQKTFTGKQAQISTKKRGEKCSDKVFHKIQGFSTHESTALCLAKRCELLTVHAVISPTSTGTSSETNEPPLWICILWLCCLIKDKLVMKPDLHPASDESSLSCPVWLIYWNWRALSLQSRVASGIKRCLWDIKMYTYMQSDSTLLSLPPQETS